MAAISNKDGKLLKSKEERQARWKEHFEGVLNRETQPNPPMDEEMGEGSWTSTRSHQQRRKSRGWCRLS